MSSQPEHSTLLIPGPIEFDDAVLQSMSHYRDATPMALQRHPGAAQVWLLKPNLTAGSASPELVAYVPILPVRGFGVARLPTIESHVGPGFVSTFGDTLSMLRKLFQTTDPSSQPFVISGSGTLGWDLVAANLVEPGENVLVLTTGYFGDSFADCFKVYGANVDQLKPAVGSRPQLPEIGTALKAKKYKVISVTHVDTSTGVLSTLPELSELVQRVSPETLLIVDGVCSVAGEEIDFDKWKLDGVVTASQKAIGCPAGLSISMFSGRAIKVFEERKAPIGAYFASMKNWTPIMRNYEAKKPSYFATPSPQLIHALNTALKQILSSGPLSARFTKHAEVSDRIKKAVEALGLKQVASKPEDRSHCMTAIYLPDSVKAAEILPALAKRNVVFAGGIHKEIAPKYIRFGHMGVSVTDEKRGDIDRALKALEDGLTECGYQKA
ncbi:hypothetical protein LA080_008746 [Diaporthe eres]|nr:hypothetical protein LA080_008746 [Diaporthe eres]